MRGWRSIHVTDGDHPYMDKWWVPGLQIGYEHTFVHQVADFLEACERQTVPARPSATLWNTNMSATRPEVREDGPSGKSFPKAK